MFHILQNYFIKTYFSEGDNNLLIKITKFFNYFQKSQPNFGQDTGLWKEFNINLNRTNNICEVFHSNLNNLVQIRAPKISFLVSILIKITTNYFNKYIENIN